MDGYQPGDRAYEQFTVTDADRNPTPADSTPTVEVYLNNILDISTSAAATVTLASGGRYNVEVPLPLTYIPGDVVHIVASGTVSGDPFEGIICKAMMQFRPVGLLESRLQAFGADAIFVNPDAELSEELSENLGDYPEHAFASLEEALSVVVENQAVILMSGDHIMTDTAVLPAGVSLIGMGQRQSRILRQDSGDGGVTGVLTVNDNCRIKHLSLIDQTTAGVDGIEAETDGATNVAVDDVYVESQFTGIQIRATAASAWRVDRTRIRSAGRGMHTYTEAHRIHMRDSDIRIFAADQQDTIMSSRRALYGVRVEDGGRIEMFDTNVTCMQDDGTQANTGLAVSGGSSAHAFGCLIAVEGGDPAYDFSTTDSTDRICIGGGTSYHSTQVHTGGGAMTFMREPMADAIDNIASDIGSEGLDVTVDFTDLEADIATLSADLTTGIDSLTEGHEDIIAAVGNIAGSVADNAVVVNHDYGGTNALAIEDPDGVGIENATIKIYLRSDYDAMNRSNNFLKGQTYSTTDGAWQASIPLDPGEYALVAFKQNQYNSVATYFTVS